MRHGRQAAGGRTAHAGVGDHAKLGTSCAWLDYDNDGWLDLFICNYVHYSLATDHACYEGGKRYYCRPNVYQPDTCILYHNRGDGSFQEVTKQTGVWNKTGNSLGVALMNPSTGYSVVWHIEIALMFVTLAAIGPLIRVSRVARSQNQQRFGLAELPI